MDLNRKKPRLGMLDQRPFRLIILVLVSAIPCFLFSPVSSTAQEPDVRSRTGGVAAFTSQQDGQPIQAYPDRTLAAPQPPLASSVWWQDKEFLKIGASLGAVVISICALLVSYQTSREKRLRERREELRGIIEKIVDLRTDLTSKMMAPLSEQEKESIGVAFNTKKSFFVESADYIVRNAKHVSVGELLVLASEHMMDMNVAEARMLYEKAAVNSRKASLLTQAIAYRALGGVYYLKPQIDIQKGAESFKKSINLSNHQNDVYSHYTTAFTYRDWASKEYWIDNFVEARKLLYQAAASSQSMPDWFTHKGLELRHCARFFGALGLKSMQTGHIELGRADA
jgi:hypothetical protein